MGQIIFLVVIFGGMWALLILPQQRKAKAHQALIAAAKAGDRIQMASGIYGTITEVLDRTLYVEIAEDIEILIARGQVTEIVDEFPIEQSGDGAVEEEA